MSEKVIELVHLQKQFGENTVLRDINLSVSKGEVLSIIGASGSGKSTMLRCINLLETPTSGQILYHGKDITGHDINLSQYRAKVGMVFQSFNLFNNMTALNNCITGQVSVLKRSREEAEAIAMKYLERVGMAPYINARPSRAARSSASRLRAHWLWSRRRCCLTSRRAHSTPRWSAKCSTLCARSPRTA